MRIEVSKSELAGALVALGKLVSRTSPVEAFRSVEIVGKENQIKLRTANAEEAIAFCIAAEVSEPFSGLVNFDDLRMVVRGGRNKSLVLSLENGQFAVDGLPLRQIGAALPDVPVPVNDVLEAALPVGFVNFLATAAPIIDRHNFRRVLQGVHLCPEGIAVTDGRELLHIPAKLNIVPLTLPFPLVLLATKSEEGGTISTWAVEQYRYFRIEIGNWTWTGKALVGPYPDWKKVIPDPATLKHVVKFDAEHAAKLTAFLKSVPDNPPNNPVNLSRRGGGLEVVAENGPRINIEAEFPVSWENFAVSVNKNLLLRLLSEGHLQLAWRDEHSPFVATLGIGTYIAMPLAFQPKTTVQTQNTEESKMNETITNVVTAPVQSAATPINPEPIAAVNPLDDLATAIDEFKSRIRAMFDESNALSRKVKEVALSQKQKERDFVLAKRAIERIRMAI